MDIESTMREYDVESDEKRVNDCLRLFTQKYHAFFDNIDLITHERKIALALNKLSAKGEIARYMSNTKHIMTLINTLVSSEDTKVRKNIYTTMSHMKVEIKLMYDALKREDSYINVLHLVELISKYDDIDVSILKAKLETIEKTDSYYSKIEHVIMGLSPSDDSAVTLRFLNKNDKVLLTTTKIGKAVLMRDTFDADIDILTGTQEGCVISADTTLEAIMKCRSFVEMLILPKGKININCDIDSIAKCINSFLNIAYFNDMFGESRAHYSYRLEIRGDGLNARERQNMTKNILAKIQNKNFINIRDRYDIEIRVYLDDNNAMVTLKLPYVDDRFDYRVGQLPASINPVTASIIAGIVEQYVSGSERILDTFVGTGTMLYELYLRLGYGEYVGVDIEQNAINLAMCNIAGLMPNLELIKSDILLYEPEVKANAIISNMPFGTRVLTHNAIETLYTAYFKRLHEILADDGVACLFTTQGKAVRESLRGTDYKIMREYRVPSGGLIPYLFIITRK